MFRQFAGTGCTYFSKERTTRFLTYQDLRSPECGPTIVQQAPYLQLMRKHLVFLVLALCTSIGGINAPALQAEPSHLPKATEKTRVYISTCSEHGPDGIYLAELDSVAGQLRLVGLVAALDKASFLALHPNHRYLYSTCEVDGSRNSTRGAVCAVKIDAATRALGLVKNKTKTAEGPPYI
jgi:hypothetical protein